MLVSWFPKEFLRFTRSPGLTHSPTSDELERNTDLCALKEEGASRIIGLQEAFEFSYFVLVESLDERRRIGASQGNEFLPLPD
jgi:hypothetical protein